MIAAFTLLDIVADLFTESIVKLDLEWAIVFTIGLIVYLTVLLLKKKTKVLDVE